MSNKKQKIVKMVNFAAATRNFSRDKHVHDFLFIIFFLFSSSLLLHLFRGIKTDRS